MINAFQRRNQNSININIVAGRSQKSVEKSEFCSLSNCKLPHGSICLPTHQSPPPTAPLTWTTPSSNFSPSMLANLPLSSVSWGSVPPPPQCATTNPTSHACQPERFEPAGFKPETEGH